jgi:hypothetical protein
VVAATRARGDITVAIGFVSSIESREPYFVSRREGDSMLVYDTRDEVLRAWFLNQGRRVEVS